MVPSIHETDGKTASREKEMKRDVKVAENQSKMMREGRRLYSVSKRTHTAHITLTRLFKMIKNM